MKNRMKNRIIILTALLIIAMIPKLSSSESLGPEMLLTGRCRYPIAVTVSSPVYHVIAQFGEERTQALNKLLRHLSVTVTLDGDISETCLAVDDEPVYSYIVKEKDSVRKTVYSIQPDTFYQQKSEEPDTGNTLMLFLDGDFFTLNRMLDDFYPLFEKTAESFKEYAKSSAAVSLNFRGYGKGVRKLTIPLPDNYIRDKFPEKAASLADTDEARMLIMSLLFSGTQKIILLYDQDDRLLRINYDGSVGNSEESIRKVSAVWRCVRTDKRKKDHLTLKTPSVKGTDKYNLIYEREVDESDSERQIIKWDLQLDLKEGEVRKKITFNADLQLDQNILSGKILYSEKQDGNDKKTTIIPSMKKENESEYSGTIEIANNSGKIVTSSTQYTVRVIPGKELTEPESIAECTSANPDPDTESGEELLRQRLDSVLLRKLLSLPPEDTEFFSLDIPQDVWNTLVKSLF